MLKKILCTAGVVLLMAFSGTQAAELDATSAARIKAGAERGDARDQYLLAACYDFADCKGIPHDYAKARQLYEKAAAQGLAESYFNLGIMYAYGKGVRRDYAKARKLYEKAAVQGVAPAQYNLGLMYYNGQGGPQNRRTAKKWFGKACDNRDPAGCDKYRKLKEAGF